MKKNYLFVVLVLLASGFVGCSDDDDSYDWYAAYMEEQARLADFVKDKTPLKTFTHTNITFDKKNLTDYAYLFGYDENGVKPKPGQFVLVNYVRKSLNEQILDATYLDKAVGAQVTPYYKHGGPVYLRLNDTEIPDATSDALECMGEGTTGNVLLSRVWTNMSTFLYIEYTIEKIIQESSLLVYENKMIENSLEKLQDKKQVIPIPANETNAGDTIAKLAILKQGMGEPAVATDSVTIWLEGEILDEVNTSLRKFLKMEDEDSSEKVKVSDLPTKGLRMALLKLREGDEAKLFLPSGMAYGYEGWNNDYTGQIIIPSYSTLVFTIKVKKVEKNPAKN